MNRLIYFSFFFAAFNSAESFLPFAVVKGIAGVVEFGMNIAKMIDKQNHQNNPADNANLAMFLSEMQSRIDYSSTKIITTVLLQSKLDRIDDAFIAIRTSLIDLSFYLKSNKTVDKQHYKDLFLKNYGDDSVDMHLNFLPDLLTYTIPGTSGPLIELFTEQTRCNMTAMEEFEKFYFDLVSDGIAVQFVSLRFSNTTLDDKVQYWNQQGTIIDTKFTRIINNCKSQFEQLATQDIEKAKDGSTLWNNNNQRYTWLRNNVLFLYSYGTYQFLYVKYIENYVIMTKSKRIVIFTDKNDKALPASAFSLLNDTSNLQSLITGDLNDLTAKHVGVAVEERLLANGYEIRALVVFFDGDDFPAEFLKFDLDSQLIMTQLPVELEYCYSDWLTCKVHSDGDKNIITSEKIKAKVSGQLKVVAYVEASDPVKPKKTFKTGTGSILSSYIVTVYLLPLVVIVFS